MSEFVHRIPRGELSGIASDPDQTVSNAGQSQVEQGLSAKSAMTIAVAANSARKVVSTSYNVLIEQTGDSSLKRDVAIGGQLIGYAGIALTTKNPYAVGAAIGIDFLTGVIKQTDKYRKIDNDNAIKEITRGNKTMNGGYYD